MATKLNGVVLGNSGSKRVAWRREGRLGEGALPGVGDLDSSRGELGQHFRAASSSSEIGPGVCWAGLGWAGLPPCSSV